MSSEETGKARKLEDYLNEWLRRHGEEARVAPIVVKWRDMVQWVREAIEEAPEEAGDIFRPDLGPTFDSDEREVMESLPLPFEYKLDAVTSSSAFLTSGTSAMSLFAERVEEVGTPEAREYAVRVRTSLKGLHEKYDRVGDLRGLLEELDMPDGLNKRLDDAERAFMSFKAGTERPSEAANAIRLLLDGAKGELWAWAFKEGENKSWEGMAARLARGGVGSDHHRELLDLKATQSYLEEALGDVVHQRKRRDLEQLWVETVTYLIATLGHVNPPAS